MKLNKDFLYVASTLIAMGIVWGTLSAKVNAQEEAIKPIPSMITRQAIMDTKLDYLIGLLEFKYGIKSDPPARPKLLNP